MEVVIRKLTRPRYAAGAFNVYCHRWWSLRDRRDAKRIAKLVAHLSPELEAELRDEVLHTMLYGHAR